MNRHPDLIPTNKFTWVKAEREMYQFYLKKTHMTPGGSPDPRHGVWLIVPSVETKEDLR